MGKKKEMLRLGGGEFHFSFALFFVRLLLRDFIAAGPGGSDVEALVFRGPSQTLYLFDKSRGGFFLKKKGDGRSDGSFAPVGLCWAFRHGLVGFSSLITTTNKNE